MAKTPLLNLLGDLNNSNTAISVLNTNTTNIQAAWLNTLSLDGSAPNQMGANLDMNSNRIINLPAPLTNSDAARLVDVNNAAIGVLGVITATELLLANTTQPQIVFSPSSGATINGQIYQAANLLHFTKANVGDMAYFDMTNSIFNVLGNGIAISPTPSTSSPGLVIVQSSGATDSNGGLATGIAGSGFAYNSTYVSADSRADYGISPFTYGSRVYMFTGGTNARGSKIAFGANIFRSAPDNTAQAYGDTIALNCAAVSSAGDGGTGVTIGTARGTLFGLGCGATAATGSTNLFVVSGSEFDIGIQAGASSYARLGLSMVGTGSVQGASVYDAAYEVSATGAVVLAATASWTTANNTITMVANPGTVVPGMNVFDSTNSKPIGTVLTYVGTTLTLTSTATNASSGSTDSLIFNACAWKMGLMFSSLHGNVSPVTGTLIGTDATAMTFAKGVDFGTGVTFTGNAWTSPGFSIGSSGAVAALSYSSTGFSVSSVGAVAALSYSCTGFSVSSTGAVSALSYGSTGFSINSTGALTATGASTITGGLTLNPASGVNLILSGSTQPQMQWQPSSGATKQAQIYQSTNTLIIGDANVASRVVIDIATGQTNICAASATPAGGTAGLGLLFGTTANFGIFYGSSTPTLSAAKGSLYLRSDGAQNARLYINTDGGTTWTAFSTTS